MSELKYTRAIVNVSTLHVNGLHFKPTRGDTVEGDTLALLLAKKADISEDPKSGSTLIWDLSSVVQADAGAVGRKAAEEAKAVEEKAAQIAADMEAEAEERRAEMAAAAEATGESVKAAISKKPARK